MLSAFSIIITYLKNHKFRFLLIYILIVSNFYWLLHQVRDNGLVLEGNGRVTDYT